MTAIPLPPPLTPCEPFNPTVTEVAEEVSRLTTNEYADTLKEGANYVGEQVSKLKEERWKNFWDTLLGAALFAIPLLVEYLLITLRDYLEDHR